MSINVTRNLCFFFRMLHLQRYLENTRNEMKRENQLTVANSFNHGSKATNFEGEIFSKYSLLSIVFVSFEIRVYNRVIDYCIIYQRGLELPSNG